MEMGQQLFVKLSIVTCQENRSSVSKDVHSDSRLSDVNRHCEGTQTHLKYDRSVRPFMQPVAKCCIKPSRLVLCFPF